MVRTRRCIVYRLDVVRRVISSGIPERREEVEARSANSQRHLVFIHTRGETSAPSLVGERCELSLM